jgi:hypothetical protein
MEGPFDGDSQHVILTVRVTIYTILKNKPEHEEYIFQKLSCANTET